MSVTYFQVSYKAAGKERVNLFPKQSEAKAFKKGLAIKVEEVGRIKQVERKAKPGKAKAVTTKKVVKKKLSESSTQAQLDALATINESIKTNPLIAEIKIDDLNVDDKNKIVQDHPAGFNFPDVVTPVDTN